MNSIDAFHAFDFTTKETEDISFTPNNSKIKLSSIIDGVIIPDNLNSSLYLLCILWKDTDSEQYILYSQEMEKVILFSMDTNTITITHLTPLNIAELITIHSTSKELLNNIISCSDEKFILQSID